MVRSLISLNAGLIIGILAGIVGVLLGALNGMAGRFIGLVIAEWLIKPTTGTVLAILEALVFGTIAGIAAMLIFAALLSIIGGLGIGGGVRIFDELGRSEGWLFEAPFRPFEGLANFGCNGILALAVVVAPIATVIAALQIIGTISPQQSESAMGLLIGAAIILPGIILFLVGTVMEFKASRDSDWEAAVTGFVDGAILAYIFTGDWVLTITVAVIGAILFFLAWKVESSPVAFLILFVPFSLICIIWVLPFIATTYADYWIPLLDSDSERSSAIGESKPTPEQAVASKTVSGTLSTVSSWSEDGDLLAIGQELGTLLVSSSDFKVLHEIDIGAEVTYLEFIPDGNYLLVGSQTSSTLLALDLRDYSTIMEFSDFKGESASVSSDGKYLAYNMRNEGKLLFSIILRDLTTGSILRKFENYRDPSFGYGNRYLGMSDVYGTGYSEGKFLIWDVVEDRQHALLELDVTRSKIGIVQARTLDISSDEQFVATNGETPGVVIWDATTGEPIARPPTDQFIVNSLTFSPTNNLLAYLEGGGPIYIWDTDRSKLEKKLQGCESEMSSSAAPSFSSDGTMMAVNDPKGHACIWQLGNGELLKKLDGTRYSMFLEFSPDGDLIAVRDQVWDVQTGELVFSVSPNPD